MTGTRDLPEFPNIEEDLRYNPARFLDWQLTGAGPNDSDVGNGRVMLLKAKVRGIDRIRVLRAFEAVERNDRVGPKDGPRSGVLQLLHQREDKLREIGERPDRVPYGPRRPCECCDPDDGLSASEAQERRREERARSSGYNPSGVDTSETSSRTETTSLDSFGADDVDEESDSAVATDGGEGQ